MRRVEAVDCVVVCTSAGGLSWVSLGVGDRKWKPFLDIRIHQIWGSRAVSGTKEGKKKRMNERMRRNAGVAGEMGWEVCARAYSGALRYGPHRTCEQREWKGDRLSDRAAVRRGRTMAEDGDVRCASTGTHTHRARCAGSRMHGRKKRASGCMFGQSMWGRQTARPGRTQMSRTTSDDNGPGTDASV